jgi:hypothetical protein
MNENKSFTKSEIRKSEEEKDDSTYYNNVYYPNFKRKSLDSMLITF